MVKYEIKVVIGAAKVNCLFRALAAKKVHTI